MRLSGLREEYVAFEVCSIRETLRCIEVVLQSAHHAEQMPWIRVARRKLRKGLKDELNHFRLLFLPVPELFPTLWEGERAIGAAAQVDLLRHNRRAYAEAVVRRLSGSGLLQHAELRQMLQPRWYRQAASNHSSRDPQTRAMLEEFIASPSRSLERFCKMLLAVNEEIVRPVWGTIESELRQDVEMRRDVLKAHGIAALLRTLSPQLLVHQASDDTAEIELATGDGHVHFGKRCRLALAPSFFCWPHVQAYVVKRPGGLRCSISYPIPPLPARVALQDRPRLATTVAALGDETRLQIVELLHGRDLSTRELSSFLHTAAPHVSRHLHVLLRAQLVERYRNGYFVMYRLKRKSLAEAAAAIGAFA